MTMQDEHRPMTSTTRDEELVAAIKDASTPEERRKAVRELAKRNIERHQGVYDRLARK
ncbi:hypothetical protein ACFQL7_25565 [Halocatena marina]|uniref:Uncharacterized protein n=3 Tax=Halocatena marina TaxID=2934937 RepID=A0ABD5YXR2_9EURY